jgi:hypothetical protein
VACEQHCAATQLSHASVAAGGTIGTTPPHTTEQEAAQELARHERTAPSGATSETASVSHVGSHVASRGSQPSVQSSRDAQLAELVQAATSGAHSPSTQDTHCVWTEERDWMPAICRHAGAAESAATRRAAVARSRGTWARSLAPV